MEHETTVCGGYDRYSRASYSCTEAIRASVVDAVFKVLLKPCAPCIFWRYKHVQEDRRVWQRCIGSQELANNDTNGDIRALYLTCCMCVTSATIPACLALRICFQHARRRETYNQYGARFSRLHGSFLYGEFVLTKPLDTGETTNHIECSTSSLMVLF